MQKSSGEPDCQLKLALRGYISGTVICWNLTRARSLAEISFGGGRCQSKVSRFAHINQSFHIMIIITIKKIILGDDTRPFSPSNYFDIMRCFHIQRHYDIA